MRTAMIGLLALLTGAFAFGDEDHLHGVVQNADFVSDGLGGAVAKCPKHSETTAACQQAYGRRQCRQGSAAKNEWPFAILRICGNGKNNDAFLKQVVAAQDRHPGLIDEAWLGGCGALTGTNTFTRGVVSNLAWRDRLRQHGIGVGYQQGPTLNYNGTKDHPVPGFSDEAWLMTADGVRHPSLFCATSPEAYAENLRVAKTVMEGLKPDSYWPDDDMRFNDKRGGKICFCDRCVRLFNEEFRGSWTRETLAAALFGPTPSKVTREQWTEFNRRVLGRFAAVYREAADAVHPNCRLGIQATSSYECYNGRDFRPILESLSGSDHRKVGIRPSNLYYGDHDTRQVFRKALYIMNEGTRCKTYGFVGQICYEAENWPHISTVKNPASQMMECSLMLAVGCDSLALYWGDDRNRESDENYAWYFDTFARWKPFLRTIRDRFAGSVPAGVSEFRGSDEMLNHWINRRDPTEERLIENSVPLTCAGGLESVYWLSAERAKDVTEDDLVRLFAKPVMMDVPAFQSLAAKFPSLPFVRKVRIESVYNGLFVSAGRKDELFAGNRQAMNLHWAITPLSADVRPLSSVTGLPGACGTCVVPSGFGGSFVLFQQFACNHWLWTGPRRETILDAVDSLVPGGLNVRLLTSGYVVAVHGRADKNGRTVGAYLLNAAAGETPPLEIAIRHPLFADWNVCTVEGVKTAEIVRRTAEEVVLRVPSLGAWQPLLVEGM